MKKIVQDKIFDFERHAWDSFCESHPDMRVGHSCLENVDFDDHDIVTLSVQVEIFWHVGAT